MIIKKKDTRYLKWKDNKLVILLNWSGEEKIVCDKDTKVVYNMSGGFSGFRIDGIRLSSAIGRQLHNHVTFLRQELYGDIFGIKFEN